MIKMYRNIVFVIAIFFLEATCLYGQTTTQTTTRIIKPADAVPVYGQPKFAQSVPLVDVNGRPFQNVPYDVDGSPYFMDEFRHAKITLSKGKVYENAEVKIDLYNQEVHVLDSNSKEIIAEDGSIREVIIIDTGNTQIIFSKFQTGFPSIDKNNTNSLYRVLSDGKARLLLSSKKEIAVTKDVMTGEVHKEFLQRDDYYVFQNGEITKLNKDKNFVLVLMMDQEKKISDYLNENKVSFKKQDMLIALFNYYNSLFKGF